MKLKAKEVCPALSCESSFSNLDSKLLHSSLSCLSRDFIRAADVEWDMRVIRASHLEAPKHVFKHKLN
jgi:hypothetical protein